MYVHKIDQKYFYLNKRKNFFFIFYLLKTFEKRFHTGTGLTHVLADFKGNRQHFLRPCAKAKSNNNK